MNQILKKKILQKFFFDISILNTARGPSVTQALTLEKKLFRFTKQMAKGNRNLKLTKMTKIYFFNVMLSSAFLQMSKILY